MKKIWEILAILLYLNYIQADICSDSNLPLGTHIRDPTNCAQFYICDVNGAVLFTCAAPTVFNSIHLGCDWPENVNCAAGPPAPPSPICNGQALGTHIRNPQVCSEFFICDHSGPVRFQCNPPLVFNTVHNGCDFAENVNCAANVPLPDALPPAQIPPAPSPVLPVPNSPPGGVLDPQCTANVVYLPEPTSCDLFRVCIRGFSVRLSCPPTLQWNTAAGMCQPANVAGCTGGGGGGNGGGGGGGGGGSGNPDVISPNTCPAVDNINSPVFFPHPQSCTLYLACSRGRHIVVSCPVAMHWNTATARCESIASANCVR